MKKLNLGCGQFPKKGYINLDIAENSKADIIHDLLKFPYPFKNEEIDYIEMNHVLEHLENVLGVMKENYRILKKNGILRIRVPHFSRGFRHYDHKRGFDVCFPNYFDKNFKGGYTGIPLKHESTKLTWFAQKYLKKQYLHPVQYLLGYYAGVFFDLIGNINHYFTSRILCFYVGGYEEIEFIFKKAEI